MEKIKVRGAPKSWQRSTSPLTICPGCQHGVVAELLCDAVDELGIQGNTIVISGIGCAGIDAFMVDMDAFIMCPHGRTCDVATGIKRALFGKPIVVALQGDGDCIAIGAGSLISAALRGEKITVIMANNANYGTTGGQLAPTTLLDQVTSTTPEGRDPGLAGYPAHVPEMLVPFRGVAYAARGAVNTPANYQRTKRYLKAALQKQIDNIGLSFVEILSACPANWHRTPVECLKWIEEKMIPEYPLGEFKNADRID